MESDDSRTLNLEDCIQMARQLADYFSLRGNIRVDVLNDGPTVEFKLPSPKPAIGKAQLLIRHIVDSDGAEPTCFEGTLGAYAVYDDQDNSKLVAVVVIGGFEKDYLMGLFPNGIPLSEILS